MRFIALGLLLMSSLASVAFSADDTEDYSVKKNGERKGDAEEEDEYDRGRAFHLGIAAMLGNGKGSDSQRGGFTYAFDATVRSGSAALGAFYLSAPFQELRATAPTLVDRRTTILGGAAYYCIPFPILDLRAGLKAGSASSSTESSITGDSSFVLGPSAAAGFGITRNLELGVDVDYLLASASVGGNLVAVLASARYWF